MLITGGISGTRSAEIYHPDRDSACILTHLPEKFYGHTLDGSMLCGGRETFKSCRKWNPETGAWDLVTEALTDKRLEHTSWTPVDGSVTYLIGGAGSSGSTTDILDHNNSSASFPLKHVTR